MEGEGMNLSLPIIAKLEKAGGWARHLLRISEQAGRGYRGVLAASGAVGLHELINASGDDENPNFHDRYAGALSAASTGWMLVAAERGGTAVTNWLKGAHQWGEGSAKAIGKFIETSGFVFMDEHNRELMTQVMDGDLDAAVELSGQFFGTYAGLLGLSRGVTPDRYKHWRKDYPELNDLQLRRETQAIRNREQGPPPRIDPALDRATMPLFRAGMEVRGDMTTGKIGAIEGEQVTLRIDGSPGSVRLVSNGGEIAVEVDPRIWKAIRGEDTPGQKVLAGEPAREFFDQLAMTAMRTRLAAGMVFSREGQRMVELEDGVGRWLRDDGYLYQIGLDGMIRRREFSKQGSAWEDVGRAQMPESNALTAAGKGVLQPWLQISETLRSEAADLNSPVQLSTVRLFDAAIQASIRGRKDHPWLAELREFMADEATISLLDQGISPGRAKELAWWMGAVGTGNVTAAYAQARLAGSAGRPSTGKEPKVDEIDAKAEAQPEAKTKPAEKTAEASPEGLSLKRAIDAQRREIVEERPEEARPERPEAKPIEKMKVSELQDLAAERGVEVPKKATKPQLIQALREPAEVREPEQKVEDVKPDEGVEISAPREVMNVLRDDIQNALTEYDAQGEGLAEQVRLESQIEGGAKDAKLKIQNRKQGEELLIAAREAYEDLSLMGKVDLSEAMEPVIQKLTEYVGRPAGEIVQERRQAIDAEQHPERAGERAVEPASELETARPPEQQAIDIMGERDWPGPRRRRRKRARSATCRRRCNRPAKPRRRRPSPNCSTCPCPPPRTGSGSFSRAAKPWLVSPSCPRAQRNGPSVAPSSSWVLRRRLHAIGTTTS